MRLKQELADARRRFDLLNFYGKFEQIVIFILTVLIAVFVIFAVWNLALKVLQSIASSTLDPTDYSVFQTVFGAILTVIIALEFKKSLLVSAERQQSVVQVRTVILRCWLSSAKFSSSIWHTQRLSCLRWRQPTSRL
jgi:phosphate-starvation-inducible protein E